MKRLALTSTLLLLAACAPSAPPATEAVPVTPSATDAAGSAAAVKPRFVDRVWRVESSTAVAPGMLYTFLADGTLVMQAQSTPGYGRWTYENGALVMIEEGIAYPTDILALDDSTFSIRSHNPGEPVDIKLVAADNVPLPQPPAK